MAKQDCPYCGKVKIDGRHINLCSKNPKNMSVEALPLESVPAVIENATSKLVEPTVEAETASEAKVVETVVAQVATPVFEPLDEVKTLNCPTCGEKSVWLNSLDYRCPNCGDHELRRPMPVKGI